MTTNIAKYISKKVLKESAKNHFGSEDPYFEQVPATRLDGRPSKKTKKQRKALPAGISEHDGKVLTKVKRRAYRLDMSFSVCGIRMGWGSLIGLVPAIGDVLDTLMAIMVVRTCQQVEGGLPASVMAKMYFNIIFDFGIGLVPVLGDLADAIFRANTRNAIELEKYLRQKGAAAIKAQGRSVPTIDPSDPAEYDRYMSETPPPHNNPPFTANGAVQPREPKFPEPVRTLTEKCGGQWFGFGGRTRQSDLERGLKPEDRALPSSRQGQQRHAQPISKK